MEGDNVAAIHTMTNEVTNWCSRHYDMKAAWLREKIYELKIKMKHVSGKELVSDCLTKVLTKDLLAVARRRLGLH